MGNIKQNRQGIQSESKDTSEWGQITNSCKIYVVSASVWKEAI